MNFWKYLLPLFSFLNFFGAHTYAQVGIDLVKQTVNPFDELNNLYQKNNLNDTIYMGIVDSLAIMSLDKGVTYSINEMVNNLKQYERIAWSKDEYWPYRTDYYVILLNNAYLSGKWGASIYYAEKITKQSEIDSTSRSFLEQRIKIHIYDLMKREDKIIEMYEENQKLFEDLVNKIADEPNVYYWDGRDVLGIFEATINNYLAKKDTVKSEKVYRLANSMVKNMNKASTALDRSKRFNEFCLTVFDFYKAYSLEKNEEALCILNKMDASIEDSENMEHIIYNLLDWKADVFLKLKQADSASYYIDKMESSPNFGPDQLVTIYKYKARLELIKNNPEKAYEFLNNALEESSKMRTKLAIEMDNMLYAQTEAEHHRLAFEKSEQEKKQRNMWIGGISLLSVVIISIIIILLRKKDKKLKEIINNLKETANIQIALMDQFKSRVRKEEQERISQNLHDDLAGTLVAVKNNVDIQIAGIKDDKKKEKFRELAAMIEKAFYNVRNKSHELFEMAQLPDEEMFCQHIRHLAEVAFPEKYYTFNIEVDDYALVNISLDLRSELIRVVQEAFTNIIKHAKATRVDLLIYKESGKIFIVIKDNGKGLRAGVKEKTLGIQSMQNRLKRFDAYFNINGNKNGVEIIISIPDESAV